MHPVNIAEAVKTRSFLSGLRRKGAAAQKRARACREFFSHRDVSRRIGYPHVNFVTD